MDWLVAPGTSEQLAIMSGLILEHLRRHAVAPESDLPTDLLHQALTAGEGLGTLWVRLDWEEAYPTLTIWGRPSAVDPGELGVARDHGVFPADRPTVELHRFFGTDPVVSAQLPVMRGAAVDIDLAPDRIPPADAAAYAGAVAAILAGQADAGLSQAEAAAIAGATAAATAAAAWSEDNGHPPGDARDVADAFQRFVNGAGASFAVVEADERRVVLANRTCPYGPGVTGREALCRTTSALLGSLGARANGSATVTLDESIAAGDHRCRAIVDLDGAPSRWSHRYTWPPASAGTGARLVTRGFRIAISLQLPRDHLSVPLIRHTVGNTLREVGAVDEDVHAVETAVSEAAGNVIRHAGRGDAYDVEVTIGPALAELRVIDIGRGFDSENFAAAGDDPDAEHGRGMALMNALVDQARFASAPERGTIVHLVKHLSFDEDAPARKLMLAELAGGDDDRAE